jgi:hypothetical protein
VGGTAGTHEWELRTFEIALRVELQAGAVTHELELGGCAMAAFDADCRSVYRSHPSRWGGYDDWVHRSNLLTSGDERLYKSRSHFPKFIAATPNGHIHAIIGTLPGGSEDGVYRMDAWHKSELAPIPTPAEFLAYS